MMKLQKSLSLVAIGMIVSSISLYATASEKDAHGNVTFGEGTGSGGGYNTTQNNTFLGLSAGHDQLYGEFNTFVGFEAGYKSTNSEAFNTYIGESAGSKNHGDDNTFIGSRTGTSFGGDSTGNDNVFVGYAAGGDHESGDENTLVGSKAHVGYHGVKNTCLGFFTGGNISNDINGSVLLGYKAGYNATRNNTLYITNNDTNTPLIYGEFDTPMVKINGELNTTKAITASFEGSTDKAALKMVDISVNNTNDSKKSDVGFAMTNARENFSWSFRTWEPDSGFAISKYGNGATKEFRLHDANPTDSTTVVLTLANGAWCDGVWHNTSSRSMKQDIKPLNTKEALEAFKKLQPVTYAYKANPTDPKVGFIAEDVPELVADPKHKSLSAMDIVALLTKVVQVQEKKLEAEDEEMKKLQNRVKKMETIMSNLSLNVENSDKDNLSLSIMTK